MRVKHTTLRDPAYIGQTFNLLTIQGIVLNSGKTRWNCNCLCGNTYTQIASQIKRGTVKSCGCLKTTVAHTHPLEYQTWENMKQRCYNPKKTKFYLHGGKGVTVCERWRKSFKEFLADMGKRPTPQHSIERRDGNGNYEPDNCYWATKKEQAYNTTRTHHLTHDGITMCGRDWAIKIGIKPHTLYVRIQRWGVERALNTPRQENKRRTRERWL